MKEEEEEKILNEESINKEENGDKSEVLEEIKEESQENKKNDEEKTVNDTEKKKDLPKEETLTKINEVNQENVKPKSKKKVSLKIILLITTLVILVLFFSSIFAILNMGNANVIEGVYIENIDVSNLSNEQLTNIVNKNTQNIEEIELNYGEYSTIVKLEDIGIQIDTKKAINEAINLGKTNNIIVDNYIILKTILLKTRLELDIKIDETKFQDVIKNIQAEIPEAIKEYSYDIEGEKLIITNGKSGQKIISEELRNKIIENIKEQFGGNIQEIDIPTKMANPSEIDIEKIYNEVYKEPKNAYIIEEPFELHKEEDGINFGITMQQAKELLKENKETYVIPLKITKPEVEIADLGDKLFKQTLSKYTTIYDAGNKNRSHNIELAAKTINGTILLPGETFSYNGVLGNTNKEKGYKEGTAYVGGKVVKSYGGGICQVSSTLYNSVLYANLEIVERYNHSYIVSYVPAGRDATVAYGGKDFKFKNTRNYPIKIAASAKNGVVSISIMGIKEEIEYEVVLTSTVLSTTPRSVVYEDNSELPEGTQKVIQSGYDGKKSIAYKTIKYNGKTISKTVLSKDTYKPMNKIIEVGTKKVSTPVTTTPTVTTEPETNIQETTTTTNTNVQ